MRQIILTAVCLCVAALATDAPPANWAVVLRPTKVMMGQQQVGQLEAGATVSVGQIAGNGWANVTAEVQGKPLNGWVLSTDAWIAGPIKPDGEWVFQKGLEYVNQTKLAEALVYIPVAAQMTQNPIHMQTQRVLEAVNDVLRDRAQKLPRITEKLARAAQMEKEGNFQLQAKGLSGKSAGEREGAEKVAQARNLKAEVANDQRDLDNAFYGAMADVGQYVDGLGAAGAWDAAVSLEILRAKFLEQVSRELFARSGAGAKRMMSVDATGKLAVAAVAQKVAFAQGSLVDVYQAQQAGNLVAANAAIDKGLSVFPHHRLLNKLRTEIAPVVEKARVLMAQSAAARQAGDAAKAEQCRQEALKITKDADQVAPPPSPAGATNAPPAGSQPPPANP